MLTESARNTALSALPATYTSLHSSYPGDDGSGELAGGGYQRALSALGVASGGRRDWTGSLAFSVPAGPIAFIGFWTAATQGVYLGCLPIGGDEQEFTVDPDGGFIVCLGHGFASGDSIVFTGGVAPGGLVSGLTYYARDVAINQFAVAESRGGEALTLTDYGGSDCMVSAHRPIVVSNAGTVSVTALALSLRGSGTLAPPSNNPPRWVLGTPPIISIDISGGVSLIGFAFDPDGDALTFTALSALPANISLAPNGQLTATNAALAGDYSVAFRVSDGHAAGTADSGPVTLRVNPLPAVQTITITAGESFSLIKFLPGPPAGQYRDTINVVDAAKLPVGATVTTATNQDSGLINTTPTCQVGLFPGISFRVNYKFNGSGLPASSETFGPYDLRVNAPLALGFKLVRTGVSYWRPQDLPLLQDGDVIEVLPRTYYSPNIDKYTFALGSAAKSYAWATPVSVTFRSATPGTRFIIDCTDSFTNVQGYAKNIVTVFAFDRDRGGRGITLTDCEIRDNYNGNVNGGGVLTPSGHITIPGSQIAFTLNNGIINGGTNGMLASGPNLFPPLNGTNGGNPDVGEERWGTPYVTGEYDHVLSIPSGPTTQYGVSLAAGQILVVPPHVHWGSVDGGQTRWAANWAFGHDMAPGTVAPYQATAILSYIGGAPANAVSSAPSAGQFSATAYTPGSGVAAGRRCAIYQFAAADYGKSCSIGFETLPANYATDTSRMAFYNTELKNLGSVVGPAHAAYSGHVAEFYLEGVWSHAEYQDGYLVKSKAKKTTLVACRMESDLQSVPPSGGSAAPIGESAITDFSISGDVTCIGCLFIKMPGTKGTFLVFVGGEWLFWDLSDGRTTSFRCYQCTFVNTHPYGAFLAYGRGDSTGFVGPGRFNDGTEYPLTLANVNGRVGSNNEVYDCIFAGFGAGALPSNIQAANTIFNVAAGADINTALLTFFQDLVSYRPITAVQCTGPQARATKEYVHPASTKTRSESIATRGAVSPTTIPSWVPPIGFFADVHMLNTLEDALAPYPGYAGNAFRMINQWEGAAHIRDYSPLGGIVLGGSGHESSVSQVNVQGKIVANISTRLYEGRNWPTQAWTLADFLIFYDRPSWDIWARPVPARALSVDSGGTAAVGDVISMAGHTYSGVAENPVGFGTGALATGPKGGVIDVPIGPTNYLDEAKTIETHSGSPKFCDLSMQVGGETRPVDPFASWGNHTYANRQNNICIDELRGGWWFQGSGSPLIFLSKAGAITRYNNFVAPDSIECAFFLDTTHDLLVCLPAGYFKGPGKYGSGGDSYSRKVWLADPKAVIAGTATNWTQVPKTGGYLCWPQAALAASANGIGEALTATVVNGGSGYTQGDRLTLVGGTFFAGGVSGPPAPAVFTVSSVSGGVVTAVTISTDRSTGANIIDRGWYSALPSNPVSTTGGTGIGCTLNVVWNNTGGINGWSNCFEAPGKAGWCWSKKLGAAYGMDMAQDGILVTNVLSAPTVLKMAPNNPALPMGPAGWNVTPVPLSHYSSDLGGSQTLGTNISLSASGSNAGLYTKFLVAPLLSNTSDREVFWYHYSGGSNPQVITIGAS